MVIVNMWRTSTLCKKLLFLFLLLSGTTEAQRLNNQWRFGNSGGGIDFNGPTAVAATGAALSTGEGSASVADPVSGQLLFYTDGVTVWNRNNQVMLNGNGLTGGTPVMLSSTTAAMICPRPGNPQQYYIFTIDEQSSNNGLRYSLVDMSLAGGLGGIVAGTKNVLLLNTNSEKLQIVPHANGNSLWVVAHVPPSTFASFLVNASGVSNAAVFSTLGNGHGNGAGHLKINKQFTQLAMANFFEGDIELFDFNWATGQVSNFRRWDFIPGGGLVYGIEFSPNGSRLYASNLDDVVQYDLSSGNIATIAASAVVVANQPFAQPATLQLGPDHRLYVASGGGVDRFECPDNLGTASNYQLNAVPGSGGGGYGLPGWVYRAGDLPLTGSNAIVFADSCLENGSRVQLRDTTKITQVRWNFGDPTSGASNQRTGFRLSHNFSGQGNYLITALLDKDCGTPDTLRLNVTIIRCGQTGLERIEVLGDSCNLSRPLQFRAVGNSNASRFFWQFNDPASSNDTLSTSAANGLVSHQFSGPGSYRICIDYAEPGQAVRQLCRTIQVGNCCQYALAVPESCIDEPLAIRLSGTTADSVRWIFEGNETLLAGNQAFEPNVPLAGNYSFTAVVYNRNCDTDTLQGVFVRKDCNLSRCTFFAANAFTPQGDGINDEFKPVLGCVPQFYEFLVYNRWGQEVFRTNQPEQGWNGSYRGEAAEQGTYQYVAFVRFEVGETRLSSGSIRLLR